MTQPRIDIKTSFSNDQSFYLLCKALCMYPEYNEFIDHRDSIIVQRDDNISRLSVMYYRNNTNRLHHLFYLVDGHNSVDFMMPMLLNSIKLTFADEFI